MSPTTIVIVGVVVLTPCLGIGVCILIRCAWKAADWLLAKLFERRRARRVVADVHANREVSDRDFERLMLAAGIDAHLGHHSRRVEKPRRVAGDW